eukprot:CAMPEP_0118858682 /NCGR_PEP_ID=MMETSP1163-20130328/5253_1 /TAXON_ID=124430 /ORGANISM="Phaeomonas parva, Strain CCMP2877" /LENGTH=174 /DNA_ID=CAMNT_0006792167 /DNA_START=164 /DNA_END=688 /DNA_ORIENTATION=-
MRAALILLGLGLALREVTPAAPVLGALESFNRHFSYYETPNEIALTITDTLTVTDADGDNINGGTVVVATYEAGDTLVVTDTTVSGVTNTYSAGTLTLSGSANAADYQTVLRSVKYFRPDTWGFEDNPNTHSKTFTFEVTDVNAETATSVNRQFTIETAYFICTDVDPCTRTLN